MKVIISVLNKIEEWTLVLVMLGLAFMMCIEVFCRYVLGFSFSWTLELARYVGVFITFLGASLGVKYGTHFSMDLVFERVSNDRFRHGLKVIVHIVSGAIFLVIAYYGWEQAMKLRMFEAKTAMLQLPKYWFYIPIPFFSVIISIRFFNLAIKHFQALVRNEPFSMIKGE